VKPALLALAVLGLLALVSVVALQTAGRERAYQNLLTRGDMALRGGDTFGAVEAYSGAVALRPESMLAHQRRGESYRLRGELEAAARDFRTATTLDPTAPRPLELLADVYFERGRDARSIETYERRLRLDPRSARVSYKLALAQYRAGDVESAMATLNDVVLTDNRSAEANYLMGLCLRDLERPRDAVESFERAVTLSPGMIPAREELASLYESLGQYTKQLEQLQVLAALDSAHVQRQVAVGVAHARSGHPEAAAVTLANALERAPTDPLIHQELGRVWLDMAVAHADSEALRKALDALAHVGAGPAASSAALTLYGRALALNGELDAAQRLLEQATRRYPVESSAFIALADLSERQNRPEAARTALLDYHALVGDGPDFSQRAARIATLSLALRDSPTAIVWLRRAIAADPANGRLLLWLAQAELQAGDVVAAQVIVARALDRDPENPELVALASKLQATGVSRGSDRAREPTGLTNRR
jgi:tetratricopeptide (TPR) repeat protein